MQFLFMKLALIFISLACLMCVVSVVTQKVSKAKRGKADSKTAQELPSQKNGTRA